MNRTSVYSLALLVLLLLGWELAARQMSELVLPAPSVVAATLFEGIKSGYFWPHIVRTSLEVLLGLSLGSGLGLIVGILMGEIECLRKLFFPYVVASQAVPKLALAPLFILWFGFGMTSKVIITALICFFPLLENTVTAIQYTDRNKLELFRVLGATRWQTLIHLKLPAGLPNIFAGFRVAVVLAVVGAVVGEFIGASEGLGAMIIASQGMMDTPLMFSVLLLLTLLGMVLYQIVHFFENRLVKPYKKETDK
ncbi:MULTISPECIES: ABC transporter permease [Geobacillus]|jgi:NitT/TauT family transport system permease protein|uniref:ABC transporter permease n=2 Tax=Geobacillus thermodenitrificans TaxID=33940 RepID=A0ABY9Q7U8_GEOTD|nr:MULTISPECIES: ABC transporter permease [Geobacillus]ABO67389.1 Putative transport system permease protein [Geobacillus thermodenitrificans NG80-2]ARA99418.1 ABC transporter permease [Geobacillus thermodenitrificans]ARP43169.1 putative ABC transporter permease protein YtlD [Geobacillus thermodenitrificans]ATO38786.1 ABC transporter permease [Geobacillus thermodenitrificans]KQB92961.1 ABC transporter permease [Geobacillus sp. PA-3]